MKFSGGVLGLEALKKKLGKFSNNASIESGEVIAEGILKIHEIAVKSIQKRGSSSGKETRYDPKRVVKVSAPGEPPNTDTGQLVRRIEFEIDKQRATGSVGTNLKYGAWLELGTRYVLPRPWLRPAYDKVIGQVIKNLQKVLKLKQ